jgi:soluble lytic murein transglycosylase-like protein
VLNTAVAMAAGAAAMKLNEQLALLSRSTEHNAQATELHATNMKALESQTRALEGGLEEVRRAVASHAGEEAIFLKLLIMKPSLDHALARRIAASVQRECMLSGQDPNLVLAIMSVESDFNPRAVSHVGATGLMQVMPHWKKVLGLPHELHDPETSIRAGIQILGYYQQMYRDLHLAVTAYNRGPGPVDYALVNKADPANGYSAKVLALASKLKTIDIAARP